jgi:hypothetical protein
MLCLGVAEISPGRLGILSLSMRVRWFFCALVLGATVPDSAQPPPTLQDDAGIQARQKIDSLRRHFDRTIFPAAEQEAWKQCVRGKREFLDAGRKSDTAFARVDSSLRQAKSTRLSPGSPEVARLLERKFLLEKGLEDRYQASVDGRRCSELEGKRRTQVEKALESRPEYRRLKAAASAAQSDPI